MPQQSSSSSCCASGKSCLRTKVATSPGEPGKPRWSVLPCHILLVKPLMPPGHALTYWKPSGGFQMSDPYLEEKHRGRGKASETANERTRGGQQEKGVTARHSTHPNTHSIPSLSAPANPCCIARGRRWLVDMRAGAAASVPRKASAPRARVATRMDALVVLILEVRVRNSVSAQKR
jgi:hypothetical protein